MAVVAAAVIAAATAVAVVAAVVVSVATTAVAIVVVAAEGSTAELASSAVVEATASTADSHAANSNTRIEPARSEPTPPPVAVPAELSTLATSIGQAWAQSYVSMLQEQERDIVGAWPGTIREARRQVLARIKSRLEPEQLDQLARITNLAARRGWETVSEPDLES